MSLIVQARTIARIGAMTTRAEGLRVASTWALPLVAFASSTALALTVFGGYTAFTARDSHPEAGLYQVLAAIASILIIIPCFTLGLAAARLGARRRDMRLAALRLTGATPAQVVALSCAEAAVQGFIGAVIGAGVYVLCLPLVAQLPFQGNSFAISELWVGATIVTATVMAVVLLAMVSALVGLRSLAISPLGVAQRHAPPTPKWAFAAGAVVVVAIWSQISPATVGIGGMLAVLVIVFLLVNLIGPFAVSVVGRILVTRAHNAESLIAARRILDDPKQVWRSVGGVTVASFVAAGTALLTAFDTAADDQAQVQLMTDMRLGVAFTLAVTFSLAAISAVLTQIASILDNRELYRNLSLAGTPFRVMNGARIRQVRTPVVVMSLVGAGFALCFLFPITGMVLLTSPLALLQLAGLIALGCGLVIAAVYASRPVLRSVMKT
ncbi:FtsX-like permease family protein [Hoyosella subflava]|uniref:Putative membrane protein n=1 Tax=Hoyosella subflava (strain DSM 45089 / JCM 17490 / NBRC 109087 / DQS3-9A1) TaxID=443218 RepID=F6EEJ0_HOYSD|nr:FtsX-like permease family protein [Hoyosella subflava]AEF39687.1 Putative membrane protein [Hoyosella subflava DQS3-9A1]